MAIEKEIKLLLPPSSFEKVFKELSMKKKVHRKRILRRYFDTKDLSLLRRGISLRLQNKSGKIEQTVKYELKSAKTGRGVLSRKEIVSILKTSSPDLRKTSFKNVKLQHIFTTDITRRYFLISSKTAAAEIAFDAGKITLVRGKTEKKISEIEIELKKGPVSFLVQLKKQIQALAPAAKIQTVSKARLGTLLYKKANSL